MYIWKTDSLVADLRDGTLSQADRFKYLLVLMLITVVIVELSLFVSEVPSAATLSESTLVILMTVAGTIWCYRVNKDGDNQEFVDRFICLSLPILVRLFLLFLLIYSLYMTLGFALFGDEFEKITENTNWIDVGFTLFFELYFYWRLSKAIGAAASQPVQQAGRKSGAFR